MAHCAFIRRLHTYGVDAYPYKCLTYPAENIGIPPKGIEDAIDLGFDDLFERWRKLTDEKLSELFERNGINESAIFEEDVPHPAQVNSVKGV